jgi:hypothetical protein
MNKWKLLAIAAVIAAAVTCVYFYTAQTLRSPVQSRLLDLGAILAFPGSATAIVATAIFPAIAKSQFVTITISFLANTIAYWAILGAVQRTIRRLS